MLDNLSVVLFKPKYPENVGAAARACLNMGVSKLVLVDPLQFDILRALPLATVHAKSILETARIVDTLPQALEGVQAAYGTTARTGGWRKGIMSPETMAKVAVDKLRDSAKVAIVFGPEDRGLTNDETTLCTGLCTIPTSREGTSLNLAQAVVVLLYELFKNSLREPFVPAGPPTERHCTVAEHEVLHDTLREAMVAIDYLKQENVDYWMLPTKRFLSRIDLKRNEFNLLMGVCRQILWVAGREKK